MSHAWMIYGANGYTGELIAREAVRRGFRPTLAGRSLAKIQPLARELDLDCRAFGLDDAPDAARHIEGHALVLHCAGPFSLTAVPMIEACLRARAHYLDITGEIDVFERGRAYDARARDAGVVLCSGVGFDVIPTDCVALTLKRALPDATHLALGFETAGGLSPGTVKTSIEGIASGGKARKDGAIVTVPLAQHVRYIDFGNGRKRAMSVPWGDVATAYYTTGIPNIEVFFPAPPGAVAGARLAYAGRSILALPWMQRALKSRIEKTVAGPSAALRDKLPTYVWGSVRNARGDTKTARVRTANTYSLTITGALAVVDRIFTGPVAGGAVTPAVLAGADLVTRLPGSGPIVVT